MTADATTPDALLSEGCIGRSKCDKCSITDAPDTRADLDALIRETTTSTFHDRYTAKEAKSLAVELAAALAAERERADGLAAKVERFRVLRAEPGNHLSPWAKASIDVILRAAPSDALAAHDAEVKAQALREVVDSAPHGDECESIGGQGWCAWADGLEAQIDGLKEQATQ